MSPSIFQNIESLCGAGFEGFFAIDDLRSTGLAAVPRERGVYIVLRTETQPPLFLERSPAGHFKGRDPTVPIIELQSRWVEGALVLYIGKAGHDTQRTTLYSRLKQFLAYGSGVPRSHHGGRLIWQVSNSGSFLICWKPLPGADPVQIEKSLIALFRRENGGRSPFANLQN